MKRILAIILAVTMIFSLCACGDDEKEEEYCSSCGKSISDSDGKCKYCDTDEKSSKKADKESSSKNSSDDKIDDNKEEETDKPEDTNEPEPQTPNPDTAAPDDKPTVTDKPQVHTHSYSKNITAATCTKQGYTTYTCSCGHSYKDNYTNFLAMHSYSDYVCSVCNEIDKSHAYEYLMNLVILNGTINKKTGNIDYVYSREEEEIKAFMSKEKLTRLAGLTYNLSNKTLCAWCYCDYENKNRIDSYAWISLYDYYYYSYASYGIESGYIDPNTFTYDPSDVSTKYSLVYSALFNLNIYFIENNLSISTYDLGFKALLVGKIR